MSEHVTLALNDIQSNPWKAKIQRGRLAPDKIDRLRASIRQTGFWENVVVREHEGEYQMAYGHKRLEAAKRELGASHKVTLPVMDLTDAQMLQAMASENATGEEESIAAQIDVITTTAAYLRERFERDGEVCESTGNFVLPQDGKTKLERRALNAIAPDAQERISWFLGEKNWSRQKISDLLKLDAKLAPELKASVLNLPTGSGKDDGVPRGALGTRAATILATLNHAEQRAVHDVLAKSGQRIGHDDMSRIVRTAQKAPPADRKSAALAVVRKVVDEVKVRALPVRPTKKRGETQDLLRFLARQLPDMRKLERSLERINMFLNEIGENVLATDYANHHVVRDYCNVAEIITQHWVVICGPIRAKRRIAR